MNAKSTCNTVSKEKSIEHIAFTRTKINMTVEDVSYFVCSELESTNILSQFFSRIPGYTRCMGVFSSLFWITLLGKIGYYLKLDFSRKALKEVIK